MIHSRVVAMDAVVLHLQKYGDAHLLVQVLTSEHGTQTLLARGGRASKRRFAGLLDLFVTLRLQVQCSNRWWVLQAADGQALRVTLRDQLPAIWRASALCQMVRFLVPSMQPALDIWLILNEALDSLAAGLISQAANGFVRLAAACGLMPQLFCYACGSLPPAILGPHQEAWSLVCRQCHPGVRRLLPSTLASLSGAPIANEETAMQMQRLFLNWTAMHTRQTVFSMADMCLTNQQT